MEQAISTAADAVETIIDGGIIAAMNQFNARGGSSESELSQ